MAIAQRDANGRARSRYSDLELYELVAKVATRVSGTRPETLTQPAFDAARAEVKAQAAPSARAICMRLGPNGTSLPWREVVSRALDTKTDREARQRRESGATQTDYLNPDHVFFAINLAARELDEAPTEDHYNRIRQRLIDSDHRRGGRVMETLLPTSGQAMVIAKRELGARRMNWADVLRLAGLKAPRKHKGGDKPPVGIDPGEAVDVFVDANKHWPSSDQLLEFATELDVPLNRRAGEKHGDYIRRARERRTARGASSPPGDKLKYGEGNLRVRLPKVRPDWPRRGDPSHDKTTCLAAVKRYLASLPKGNQPTKKGYMAFAAEHGLPSHASLDHHGGFKALVAEARRG